MGRNAQPGSTPLADCGIGWTHGVLLAAAAAALALLAQAALPTTPRFAAAAGAVAAVAVTLIALRRRATRALGRPVAAAAAPVQQPAPEEPPEAARSDQLHEAAASFAWDRLVLASLRDAVLVFDDQGRVVSANASTVQWFELAAEALPGSAGRQLLPGEPGKALADALDRVIAGHATEVQTTALEHGRRKLDLDVGALHAAAGGKVIGIVATFRDVTKNHELARLRDDLLSSISHELRTPLTNLCSSSEILAQIDPAHEPDWRDFVHILHTESHRLKSLVDDVMSYRQVENARAEWHIEPHDADHLARDAVKLTMLMVRKAQVTLALQIDSSAAVLCDGPRILEVLVRLIDNACKFGRPHGHIRIQVQALEDRVEFAVADDGPGIAECDRQRVFDRFVQVGSVLTDKPRGAGLGLSISQRIVDAMGGAIWCEDSPLGGIQVRFMLPLARGAAQSLADAAGGP